MDTVSYVSVLSGNDFFVKTEKHGIMHDELPVLPYDSSS